MIVHATNNEHSHCLVEMCQMWRATSHSWVICSIACMKYPRCHRKLNSRRSVHAFLRHIASLCSESNESCSSAGKEDLPNANEALRTSTTSCVILEKSVSILSQHFPVLRHQYLLQDCQKTHVDRLYRYQWSKHSKRDRLTLCLLSSFWIIHDSNNNLLTSLVRQPIPLLLLVIIQVIDLADSLGIHSVSGHQILQIQCTEIADS